MILFTATQLWRNKVAAVAKDYKDVKFAIANEDEYITSLMKEFGLEESGEEFNIGCFKEMKKYRYSLFRKERTLFGNKSRKYIGSDTNCQMM